MSKIWTKVNNDCDSIAESLEIFAKIISVTSISGLLVEREFYVILMESFIISSSTFFVSCVG
jgi:hypothetical protein